MTIIAQRTSGRRIHGKVSGMERDGRHEDIVRRILSGMTGMSRSGHTGSYKVVMFMDI